MALMKLGVLLFTLFLAITGYTATPAVRSEGQESGDSPMRFVQRTKQVFFPQTQYQQALMAQPQFSQFPGLPMGGGPSPNEQAAKMASNIMNAANEIANPSTSGNILQMGNLLNQGDSSSQNPETMKLNVQLNSMQDSPMEAQVMGLIKDLAQTNAIRAMDKMSEEMRQKVQEMITAAVAASQRDAQRIATEASQIAEQATRAQALNCTQKIMQKNVNYFGSLLSGLEGLGMDDEEGGTNGNGNQQIFQNGGSNSDANAQQQQRGNGRRLTGGVGGTGSEGGDSSATTNGVAPNKGSMWATRRQLTTKMNVAEDAGNEEGKKELNTEAGNNVPFAFKQPKFLNLLE